VVEFNEVPVIGAAERDELVRLRQEALRAMEPKRISARNGALLP
jgi:hypothetical protein